MSHNLGWMKKSLPRSRPRKLALRAPRGIIRESQSHSLCSASAAEATRVSAAEPIRYGLCSTRPSVLSRLTGQTGLSDQGISDCRGHRDTHSPAARTVVDLFAPNHPTQDLSQLATRVSHCPASLRDGQVAGTEQDELQAE